MCCFRAKTRIQIITISSFTVYPFFNRVPGRGPVSTVDERRQFSIIVYGDLLWNALVVERERERASKQYGHAPCTYLPSTKFLGRARGC